jgi:arylformamidase
MKIPPAFLSIEAMQYIVSKGVEHLLVDTPSVDRLFDDGNLSAHNIFWDTEKKKYNSNTQHKTITEMIFVDNHIEDGSYLLNLQIPAFVSDAAPSRPIIFKLNDI